MTAPRFATDLETWGDRCALIDENARRVSYTELAALADAFGAQLGADVRVIAIDARRRINAIVAYLGALRRGIPVLMFEAGPKADAILQTFKPEAEYRLDAAGHAFNLHFNAPSVVATPHSDLALLLSTSGSTGSAKLVRLSGLNLQSNADSIVEYLSIGQDDVALTSLPLHYSYGLSVLHSHLSAGAAIVVTELAVSDHVIVDLAEGCEVTSIAGVPSTYELMYRSGTLQALPSSVRMLTQAGGRMSSDMVHHIAAIAEAKGAKLFVMYGQTEATARMAYLPPELLDRHADCIGRAIPGGKLEVVDPETGEPTKSVGELVYTGPNVMMGYAYNRQDLARGNTVSSLRTGDLGRMVAPGIFRIEGRLSRFIKPLGLRIGLDELEAIARSAGAHICATGDDSGAVIVATDESKAARAKSALGTLGLPESLFVYVIRDPIPLLGNGKPDYALLLREARETAPSRGKSGATDIKAAFAALAASGSVSADTTFNKLDGDSLSYISTSLVIEDALGYLPEHWEQISLGKLIELARQPDRQRDQGWPKLDSELVLRAVAIGLVIWGHAFGSIQGGADVLLMLSGMGWARFQRVRLLNANPLAVFWRSMGRFLILYFSIVLAYSAFKGHLFTLHLLMISTFFADWGGQLNVYWFIQCLTWCVALTCLFFASKTVRDFVERKPVLSGLAFVAIALAIRLAGSAIVDPQANVMRTPDQLLVYFAGGWLMALTTLPARFAIGVLLTIVSISAWGTTNSHSVIMAAFCLVLATTSGIRLPSIGSRVVRTVARYSFYIYMTCAIPIYITDYYLGGEPGQYWLTHLLLAVGLGCGLGFVVESFNFQWWALLWPRLRATLHWHRWAKS